MALTEDIKVKAGEACLAAEEFSKVYYNLFDKKRNQITKLYMPTASLVWNGNNINGIDKIVTFYDGLPTSESTVEAIDAQPIAGAVTQGQTSILVVVSGLIKFQGNKPMTFVQNFMLTSQGNVWKIVSDCFRYQD